MKILFISKDQEMLSSGVKNKILSQINNLNELGIQTKLIIIGLDDPDYASHLSDLHEKSTNLSNVKIPVLSRIINQFIYDYRINNIINSMEKEDIAYFRYPFSWFFVPWHFLKRSRDCRVICELNSIMTEEPIDKMNHFNRLFRKTSLFFNDMTLNNIDGIVGITERITDHYLKMSENPKLPHVTISNGIDVKSVVKRKPPLFNGESIELLSVANIREWHGLDRLIEGLGHYEGDISFTIHIAGDGNKRADLMEQAERLGISKKVIFHGSLNREMLNDLFDRCHGAISSLGLHRVGLNEAAPLKAREYCARGIPFISGVNDPDFSPNFPFILNVPPDDSFIIFEKIEFFIKNIYTIEDHPEIMRGYASKNLDWRIKMEELKQFLLHLQS